MKQLFSTIFLAAFIFVSCEKSEDSWTDMSCKISPLADIRIVQTNTPATVIKGADIISAVRCEAPDLCYLFSHFYVSKDTNKTFIIKAKAFYPNALSQAVACAQAIYRVDTTVRITAPETGTYLLKFYNGNDLFKTDTVVIN